MSKVKKVLNEADVEQMLTKGASFDVMAEVLETDVKTLKKFVKKHFKASKMEKKMDDENCKGVKRELERNSILTISELSSALGLKPHSIYDAIEQLRTQGTYIESNRSGYFIGRPPTDQIFDFKTKKGEIIALVSDTHFGSKYQQITHLNTAYDMFKEQGVTKVFHMGDLVDGHGVYYGQMWEQFLSGYSDQKDYAIDNYPQRKGITTHVISGNHDDSFYKENQADIVQDICESRPDMKYMGRTLATAHFDNLSIMMVHPKGGMSYAKCFDDKTEVLTKDGFKFIKDVTENDLVATLNPNTHSLEYQNPTETMNYDWDGDLLHFEARSFDLMVTPNHKLYVKRQSPQPNTRKKILTHPTKSHIRINLDWQLLEAQDVKGSRQTWQMKRNCKWEGREVEEFEIPYLSPKKCGNGMHHIGKVKMDDWLEFVGWYLSEGNITAKTVQISQKVSEVKRQEIYNVCKRMGMNPCIDEARININSKELAQFMLKHFGTGSYTKYIPNMYKDLSQRQINILLSSLFKGDGWMGADGKWEGYKSVSKKLLDDVQECLLKVGYSGTLNVDGQDVTVCIDQNLPTINKQPTKVPYKGKVYCITVPNHIIYARRNGKVIWCGNSYKIQKYVESLMPENKPNILALGHYHTSVYLTTRNVECINCCSFQSQTPFAQALGLEPVNGCVMLRVDDEDLSGTIRSFSFTKKQFYVPIENDYLKKK